MIDERRLVIGAKTLKKDEKLKGGRYGLKTFLKVPEVALSCGSKTLKSIIARDDTIQTLLTSRGIVMTSVAMPTVGIGFGSVICAACDINKDMSGKRKDNTFNDLLKDTTDILNLGKSLKTLNEQSSMIMLAIYQKQIKEIKQEKIKEIKDYFSNQVKYYDQSILDYQVNIDSNVKEYTIQINSLIEAYSKVYLDVYKSMQNAINSQIASIDKIVKLWDKKQSLDEKEAKKIDVQIVALLQKKINYSVIIEECKARLNWCIENVIIDLNEVFKNNFYQIEIYKDGFFNKFDKIKRKILNFISGKKKLAEVIKKYKEENLKKITDDNRLKLISTITIGDGVLRQIKIVNKKIDSQYSDAIKSVS